MRVLRKKTQRMPSCKGLTGQGDDWNAHPQGFTRRCRARIGKGIKRDIRFTVARQHVLTRYTTGKAYAFALNASFGEPAANACLNIWQLVPSIAKAYPGGRLLLQHARPELDDLLVDPGRIMKCGKGQWTGVAGGKRGYRRRTGRRIEAHESMWQPYDCLDVISFLSHGYMEPVGDQSIHGGKPCRADVTCPGNLNRRRFAREYGKALAARMACKIHQDIYSILGDFRRKLGIAPIGAVPPTVCALRPVLQSVGLQQGAPAFQMTISAPGRCQADPVRIPEHDDNNRGFLRALLGPEYLSKRVAGCTVAWVRFQQFLQPCFGRHTRARIPPAAERDRRQLPGMPGID